MELKGGAGKKRGKKQRRSEPERVKSKKRFGGRNEREDPRRVGEESCSGDGRRSGVGPVG